MSNKKEDSTATFSINEKVLFCPRVGDTEEVIIKAKPKAQSDSYLCLFANKAVQPVHVCYLRKKK